MKRIFIFLLLLFSGIPLFAQQGSEFETISGRIFSEMQTGINISSLDSSAASLLATVQTNGSWQDVDYQNASTPAAWAPRLHFTRMITLARAFSNSNSSYYGSESVRQTVVNTMNYWLSLNPAPKSSNWFHYAITVPRDIGQALILMRRGPQGGISATLESQMMAWMTKGQSISGMTGSNLTDIAQHYIMRACLTQNTALLNQAITETAKTIPITASEGIQADQSYTAHGPQLHIYGYGSVFVSGVSSIGAYVTGTSYAFSAANIAILSNFVRKGFIKVSRGIYTDFNVFGRGVSRPNNGWASVSTVMKAKAIDIPENAPEYDAAIARMTGQQPASYQVQPEHLHYWRTDYTMHHRPEYSFGLRSVSSRTVKSENGNSENLKGYYLTDGVNYIAVNGNEYFEIYPVWDWNKLPGITVPEITSYPLRASWGANPGKTTFVGGASDGIYGVSTLDMNEYSTKARKGWFFFDDEIVCLGAGISSTAPQAINTTLNQCLLSGPVSISDGLQTSLLASGNHSMPLKWAWHNQVGYYFPEPTNVRISNQVQSGSWKSINSSYSADVISKDVFKLWVNHGTAPGNASYAYIVLPGKSTAQQMASYSSNHLSILSNTDTVQAVSNSVLNQLQVIFYAAGTLNVQGITLQADRPCALILKNFNQPEITVTAADPSQRQSALKVRFSSAALPQMKELTVALPAGQMAGSSVSAVINSSTPNYVAPDPEATVKIEPVADSYVRTGTYQNQNFGQDAALVIKNETGSSGREVFLKFDLSNIPAEMDSAFLKIRVSYAGADATTTQWEIYEVGSNAWTETGITWANRPSSGAKLGALPGSVAGTTLMLKITNAIRARLRKDKILTLRIASSTSGEKRDASFFSREVPNAEFRPAILVYPKQDNAAVELARTTTVSDASIRNGTYASTNYGTQSALTIKNDGSANSVREVFLKFDLGGLPSATKKANLKLHVPYAGATITSTDWEFYEVVNQNWTETGLTWANKPAHTIKIGSIQGTPSGNYVTLDISDWLDTKRNLLGTGTGGAGFVTFKVAASLAGSTADANFSSNENTNPENMPQIIALEDSDSDTVPQLNLSGQRLSQEDIQLSWSSDEENEGSFQLERSVDGQYYEAIQTVNVSDKSKSTANYSYLDHASNQAFFYRIKQIDLNGKERVGKAVFVEDLKPQITVSPNPASGFVTLNLHYEPNEIVTVTIHNLTGRQIMKQTGQKQTFNFDISGLPKGLYVVKMSDKNSVQTRQIVVQ